LHIDEISHKKGQGQFMTLISDEENVREAALGKSYEGVKKEILSIPNVSNVQKVCMDMCAPFARATREAIPNAEIVADRFHLMKLINKRLWDLNKKSYKNLDEKQRIRFSEIRYLLSKERMHLKKWEKRLIKDYLYLNKEMKDIYWKVQEFRKILFNYRGYKHSFVSQKLMEWTYGIRKYFSKFIKTLETWWNEVVNACIYKESNSRQEGINNKIKALKRRGFGYRNWLNFEYRIYGECNT
jgi:transposase